MTDIATSEPVPHAGRHLRPSPALTSYGPRESVPDESLTRRPEASIDVAVVDEDSLTREGIKAIIAGQRDLRLLHELGDLAEALPRLRTAQPDLIIADAGMACENEGEAIRAILRSAPRAKVIVFGMGTLEEEIFHALDAGAAGYLIRTSVGSSLVSAIRSVQATGSYIPDQVRLRFQQRLRRPRLTPRETSVLQLLARARSNATIAAVLGISVGTVKLHVKAILAKLGVEDRVEAAMVALERGFVRSK